MVSGRQKLIEYANGFFIVIMSRGTRVVEIEREVLRRVGVFELYKTTEMEMVTQKKRSVDFQKATGVFCTPVATVRDGELGDGFSAVER